MNIINAELTSNDIEQTICSGLELIDDYDLEICSILSDSYVKMIRKTIVPTF